MKNYYLFIYLFFTIPIVSAQFTNIPDDNFEQALIDIGLDNTLDNFVLTTVIQAVPALDLSGREISDLTGIEGFTNMSYLDVSYNQLTTINVSSLTLLKGLTCNNNSLINLNLPPNLLTLNCSKNKLTTIDFSTNVNLLNLDCSSNLLTNLDLTKSTLLNNLDFSLNAISSIDLTKNIFLEILISGANLTLGSLDLTYNTKLKGLYCYANGLTSLNLNTNTELLWLNCKLNTITSLDLSLNTKLSGLDCSTNALTSLNIKNGNNNNFNIDVLLTQGISQEELEENNVVEFNAATNPFLECIVVDEDFNKNDTWEEYIDNTVQGFSSSSCETTNIPDPAFEQALIDQKLDTTLNGKVLTSNIENAESLSISPLLGVSDLTGLNDFVNLEKLTISSDNITSLDISSLNNLKELYLSSISSIPSLSINNSNLEFLNINDCTATIVDLILPKLKTLSITGSSLKSLNTASSISLEGIYLSYNDFLESALLVNNLSLKSLEINYADKLTLLTLPNSPNLDIINLEYLPSLTNLNLEITALKEFFINSNNLSSLDLSLAPNLERFSMVNGTLTSLDFSNNPALNYLYLYDTPINSLEISTNLELTSLYLPSLLLTSLNTTPFSKLESLSINSTPITGLNISNNLKLNYLNAASSAISELDISKNLEIKTLDISDTNITNINTTNNTILQSLNITNLGINSIDITSNLLLNELKASNTLLSSLNTLNNIDLTNLDFNNTSISSIDLSKNSKLKYFSAKNTSIHTIDITYNTALESLNLSSNLISNLNVSQNSKLKYLVLDNTLLSEIDLSCNPDINSISAGNNPNLTFININNHNNTKLENDEDLKISNNPNLSCVLVDDATYSTSMFTSHIDANTKFLEDHCGTVRTVVIADANFEQALIDLGYDTAPVDGEINYETIKAITTLDVSDKNISDLSGIETFNNLTTLDCSSNHLTSLDLSFLRNLATVNCSNNNLNTLIPPLTNNSGSNYYNTRLINLNASYNSLKNLNLDIFNTLETILLNDNDLKQLSYQSDYYNNISQYNTENNPNLYCVNVDNEEYSTTNWTAIDTQTHFAKSSCKIPTKISIPDSNFEQALIDKELDNTLDGFVMQSALDTVYVLDVSNKSITSLDGLEYFKKLKDLNCSNNSLKTIELSNFFRLKSLNCSNNQITSLDVSSNDRLEKINVSNNNLLSFNIKNGTNTLIQSDFDVTGNENLTCVKVDSINHSNVKWIKKDEGLIYSNTLCGNYTEIPDPYFESYLVNQSYDDLRDGYILTSNIENLKSFKITTSFVTNFTGINDFTALKYLKIQNSNATEIDLSSNINLETLIIENCSQLTSLNLTGLTNLKSLIVKNNTKLSSINISTNVLLEKLIANNNNIEQIDLSNNTKLDYISLYDNIITELDLTKNTSLKSLYVYSNKLENMNLKNTENYNIENIYLTNNEMLNCVSVDDSNFSELNWINKDPSTSYYTNCNQTLSIENLETESKISPNPVSDILHINGIFDEIQIINQLGEILIISKQPKIDITTIKNGIYILLYKNKEQTESYKFIKI